MGVKPKEPRKDSLAKWKSIMPKQTTLNLQSTISFPHAGERQNQINNYSNQSLNCYSQLVSFLVAYNAFSHLQSQKIKAISQIYVLYNTARVIILHPCVIPTVENPGYFL